MSADKRRAVSNPQTCVFRDFRDNVCGLPITNWKLRMCHPHAETVIARGERKKAAAELAASGKKFVNGSAFKPGSNDKKSELWNDPPAKWRTTYCQSIEDRKPCKYGHTCMFAHNIEELRDPDDPMPDIVYQPRITGTLHPPHKSVAPKQASNGIDPEDATKPGPKHRHAGLPAADVSPEHCSVCLEESKFADRRWVPCGHALCNDCMVKWRREAVAKKTGTLCHVCRSVVSGNEVLPQAEQANGPRQKPDVWMNPDARAAIATQQVGSKLTLEQEREQEQRNRERLRQQADEASQLLESQQPHTNGEHSLGLTNQVSTEDDALSEKPTKDPAQQEQQPPPLMQHPTPAPNWNMKNPPPGMPGKLLNLSSGPQQSKFSFAQPNASLPHPVDNYPYPLPHSDTSNNDVRLPDPKPPSNQQMDIEEEIARLVGGTELGTWQKERLAKFSGVPPGFERKATSNGPRVHQEPTVAPETPPMPYDSDNDITEEERLKREEKRRLKEAQKRAKEEAIAKASKKSQALSGNPDTQGMTQYEMEQAKSYARRVEQEMNDMLLAQKIAAEEKQAAEQSKNGSMEHRNPEPKLEPSAEGKWYCHLCTFENEPLYPLCAMCMTPRQES